MGHKVARHLKNKIASHSWIVILEAPVTGDSITADPKKAKVGPAGDRVSLDDKQNKAIEIAPIFDNESYTLVQRRGQVPHKVMGNIAPAHMIFTTPGPPPTVPAEPDPNEVKTKLERLEAPHAADELLREDVTDFSHVALEELKGLDK